MTPEELYENGDSLTTVSRKTGIPVSTLRHRFMKDGILRTQAEARTFAKLAKRYGKANVKRRITKEHREKLNEGLRRSRSEMATGLSQKPSGYLEHTTGDEKGRGAHVVIMEKHIGRRITRSEVVHHKNEDRSDNRLENLELMTRAEHASLHAHENLHRRTRNAKGQFECGVSIRSK